MPGIFIRLIKIKFDIQVVIKILVNNQFDALSSYTFSVFDVILTVHRR